MKAIDLKLTALLALTLAPLCAAVADIRDTACRTTAQCEAEANRLRGSVSKDATSARAKAQDQFYWLGRINMASTVMLLEEGIIPARLARPIAEGVIYSIRQADQPGGKRPRDVLQIEKIISEKAGPEATLIHSGRSRQDMLATYRVAQLRTAVLDTAEALLQARLALLDLASHNVDTYVPAYTNGVQAQPVSYAHYLLAFADSFARDSQRIRELYARLNLSPMGTAVLANSSWPLNRNRLAELLGFDGLVLNSYDAGQVISYDVPIEAANIVGSVALRIGAMMQDLHTQYHQSRPWILLDTSQTYTSSAMPQKQNPGLIMGARTKASDVVALAQWATLHAHNVTPGMTDYKEEVPRTYLSAVEMLNQFVAVLKALKVDPQRSLEELNGDWTTSMELAETLQRLHQVPFRIGHHFASLVVTDARKNNLSPSQFPYARAVELYAQAIRQDGLTDSRLPLSEPVFRATLAPDDMVRSRVGIGGPQPAEVKRMLALAGESLARDQTWLAQRNAGLIAAEAKLNSAFFKYLEP
ncbi:MAG: lyase family protein [Rhodoferax sp.]|uniref:lyase family protein n=1 Tax=Rhodoferax sp. TaxID=50421 RepID=UPI00261789F2|nr:lyase family protein [Rhodoferax sp.]MDD5333231.1 lyase family protein [Rhodoferax sp.]